MKTLNSPSEAPSQTISSFVFDLQPMVIVQNNQDLIELWLHGKSKNTCDGYRRDIKYFLAFVEHKSLQTLTLNDVQAFANALIAQGYAPATQRRRLCAIKSLITFGHDLGVFTRNVGKPVKLPKTKLTIAERILSEQQVLSILSHTSKARDYALLRLLYATGARVSEIISLRWRDLQDSNFGRGQVTLFGKGQKTRTVVFSAATWQIVRDLRESVDPDEFVFKSRSGKMLDRSQVQRILKSSCAHAEVVAKVSPHWFRHSHASHALERGTPINLVQVTLGHASIATIGIYLHVRPQDSSALYLAV
ncbi:tyrosine-type recombinase/integrase [Leptolyngbyaceae cyanobacterium UHCC 1019]